MKRISLLLLYLCALAVPGRAQEHAELHEEIEAVLRDYAKGADAHDVERVKRALHPLSMQYVPRPQGLLPIDREQYLSLLSSERIGGDDRTMSIEDIRITNNEIARAVIILTGEMHFTQYVNLIRLEEQWQIASIVTSVRQVTAR